MEISPEKSETVARLGQDQVSCKTAVDDKCLQEEKNFKYLGCEISYGNEKDVQQQLSKFDQILGILKDTFQTNLVQKLSRIKSI